MSVLEMQKFYGVKKKKNPLTTWKRKLLKKSLVSGAVAKEYLGFNRLKTIDVHLDLLTGK